MIFLNLFFFGFAASEIFQGNVTVLNIVCLLANGLAAIVVAGKWDEQRERDQDE